MDHLPYPNLGVPPIVVPYLPGFEYDGEDFATFPDRVGFWKDGNWDLNRPYRQLAALAQAWLFFGLIDVFTTERMNKEVLIRRSDNNRVDEGVIDTTALGSIISWRFSRQRLIFLSSEVLEGIRARLIEAAKASNNMDRIQVDDPPSSAVFLSIKILIIYLSEAFDVRFTAPFGSFGPMISKIRQCYSCRSPVLERGMPSGDIPVLARFLMDRMGRSGWCIHQIMEVCHSHNYCVVYYYSSIARAEPWDGITHEACTAARCVAYNIIDDSAYKIRHIEECSGCELVGPPEGEVAGIVRNGDIPLVVLSPASLENQTQLEVRSATPYSRYTAISHVWIDGHGNPTNNALPRCQLQRLAARLSAISNGQQSWRDRLWKRLRGPSPTSHLLWVDTLCIPPQRDSEDQKLLRRKAIHRMALIYVGAQQVLVLDAELDQFTQDGSPRELKDALIPCSRWGGRCWTLEEGALARKCLFHFKDAAANEAEQRRKPHRPAPIKFLWRLIRAFLNFLIGTYRPRRSWQQWLLWRISPDFAHEYLCRKLATAALQAAQADIGNSLQATWRRIPTGDLTVNKFVRTWNDIGRRSTTRPEDVHPILANLTDFSAAQIMKLETPVLRTKMIAHCIGKFPLDMLWTPCSRPQANENSADRWVPSIPGPEPLVESVKLKSTGKDLVVDTKNSRKLSTTFWIPQGIVAPRFCFRWLQLEYMIECTIAEDDALQRRAFETACLILSPTIPSVGPPHKLRGARLLVTKGNPETSEPLYLRYDCPVICTVRRYKPNIEQIPSTPVMTVSQVSQGQELIIESTFDPTDREKFKMRSRNFYYVYGMFIFDILVLGSISWGPGIVMSMMKAWSPKFWGLTTGAAMSVWFAMAVLWAYLNLATQLIIAPWVYARAYSAWKATFEEDWRPKDPFVKRFIKAVCLLCREKRRKQEKEHVNV